MPRKHTGASARTSFTLREKLDRAAKKLTTSAGARQIRDVSGIYFAAEPLAREGKLAFLFPGEGSQYPNMRADLCLHFPEVRECFDQIDRVSRTIRQLLDFARMQPPQTQPVAVLPAARAVRDLLALEAERRKVRLELEVPDALPPLAANPDQLQQVLVNLVLNGCDACTDGGQVVIAASEEDAARVSAPRVRLQVRDTGSGIPQASLHRVFDPFFSTKKPGQGTGLGLTMVAQIVRNHGGQVDVQSEPGRGTCITVLWPAAVRVSEARHAQA